MRRAWLATALVVAAVSLLAGCHGGEARREGYVRQGMAFMRSGDCEGARLAFRNALYIRPRSADASVLAGEAAEKCGRLREASEMYQRALSSDRNSLQARARLGRLKVLAGDNVRALAIVTPGLRIAPSDPDLLAVRGIVRLRGGDEEGALEDAGRAVDRSPSNENAVALLAALHRREGRGDEAVQIVRRAVELKPRSAEMRLVLAQLLLALGRQESAESELRSAVELEPGRLAYRERLAQLLDAHGWSLLQEGNVLAASTILQQAAGHAPQSPVVRYHLGMAQLRAGERASATENLRFAVDSGVPFAGSEEARSALRKLTALR